MALVGPTINPASISTNITYQSRTWQTHFSIPIGWTLFAFYRELLCQSHTSCFSSSKLVQTLKSSRMWDIQVRLLEYDSEADYSPRRLAIVWLSWKRIVFTPQPTSHISKHPQVGQIIQSKGFKWVKIQAKSHKWSWQCITWLDWAKISRMASHMHLSLSLPAQRTETIMWRKTQRTEPLFEVSMGSSRRHRSSISRTGCLRAFSSRIAPLERRLCRISLGNWNWVGDLPPHSLFGLAFIRHVYHNDHDFLHDYHLSQPAQRSRIRYPPPELKQIDHNETRNTLDFFVSFSWWCRESIAFTAYRMSAFSGKLSLNVKTALNIRTTLSSSNAVGGNNSCPEKIELLSDIANQAPCIKFVRHCCQQKPNSYSSKAKHIPHITKRADIQRSDYRDQSPHEDPVYWQYC